MLHRTCAGKSVLLFFYSLVSWRRSTSRQIKPSAADCYLAISQWNIFKASTHLNWLSLSLTCLNTELHESAYMQAHQLLHADTNSTDVLLVYLNAQTTIGNQLLLFTLIYTDEKKSSSMTLAALTRLSLTMAPVKLWYKLSGLQTPGSETVPIWKAEWILC